MNAPLSSPWPEFEALFRSDPAWLGGDDAYSIPLGDERHLWLFGDSFVAPTVPGDRRSARFVNNTVAIQTGDDPRTATLEFHWGHDDSGRARAVFEDPEDGIHLWPGDGAMVAGRLVLFFMRIGGTDGGLPVETPEGLVGFRIAGWSAAVVDEPGRHPSEWEPRFLTPVNVPFAELVGNAGVFVDDGHLHAHAHPSAGARGAPGSGSYLCRWPVESVVEGDLTGATWWHDGRWVPPASLAGPPTMVLSPPLTEFTVHHHGGRWYATQLLRLGTGDLAIRSARHPTAGWSAPIEIHRAAEVGPDSDHDVIAYAGKSHPALTDDGAWLVTYATNTRALDTIYDRMDLYFPHCRRYRPAGGSHPSMEDDR